MKRIINGIKTENPTFVLLLGLCPTLAVTTTLEKSYMMGLSVLFVLLLSSIIISAIKKLVNENVKIPVYIIIIATLVTVLELLLGKYIPELHKSLGIYLPLITVNCIVLGRALKYASKEKVIPSVLDAIGIGLGFTLSLIIIGTIREIVGSGTITIMNEISSFTGFIIKYQIFQENTLLPINILITPAGAFLTLGLVIALFNKITRRGEVK